MSGDFAVGLVVGPVLIGLGVVIGFLLGSDDQPWPERAPLWGSETTTYYEPTATLDDVPREAFRDLIDWYDDPERPVIATGSRKAANGLRAIIDWGRAAAPAEAREEGPTDG